MNVFDSINNLSLIENGLIHVDFELSRNNPSYFRIAREAHLISYRSMIEALRGSANLAVTGRPSKKRQHFYQIGNEPSKEIHKIEVSECRHAWRFSEPIIADFPVITPKIQNTLSGILDFLIPYYDALAMIQAECFMIRFVHSKVVSVADEEMRLLEWLHENVRNEYEHFVPKYYLTPVNDLIECSIICVQLSYKLLFQCGNVVPHDNVSQMKDLSENIEQSLSGLINQTPA
jgi:hypothetical protein